MVDAATEASAASATTGPVGTSATADRASAGRVGAEGPVNVKAPVARPANRVAWLALLLATLAGVGTGWLVRERLLEASRAELPDAMAALAADLAAERRARLDDASRLAAGQDDLRDELSGRLAEVLAEGSAGARDWALAEAAYLLRIANHRLQLEHDVAAAAVLLGAADQVLAELDDFALGAVRSALAEEIAALRMVPGRDTHGIWLRIQALRNAASRLPLTRPEFHADGPPAVPSSSSPGSTAPATALDRLLGLVRFRADRNADRAAALAPAEAWYPRETLRLELAQAQLALLRGDPELYRATLQNARTLVGAEFDVDDAATAAVHEELLALGGIAIDAEMPDISGSLAALQRALRGTDSPR